MPKLKATYDEEIEVYNLSFPFDKEIVSIIKMIPASNRSWNSIDKTWTIDAIHWPLIKATFQAKNYFIEEKTKVADTKYNYESFFYEQTHPSGPQKETATSIAQKLSDYLGVIITTQEISELKKTLPRKSPRTPP